MNKLIKITTIAIIVLFGQSLHAQSTYYTGFDTDGERANWTQTRKGKTGPAKWEIIGNATTARWLAHSAPTGDADKDSLVDWYASPKFDFSEGGAIDSLKFNYFCFMNTFFAEQVVQVYLLVGSTDPALASSKTLLADFTSIYSGDRLWNDTGNFVIPNTPGDCYIAFKFVAIDGWSTISFDNIYITSNKVTSIVKPQVFNKDIYLYPNPSKGGIQLSLPIDFNASKGLKIELFNAFGQMVYSEHIGTSQSLELNLPKGNYFYYIKDLNGEIIQQNKLILLE